MELGIYSFAEIGADQVSGNHVGAHVRLRHLMEEIALADQAGLDVFAVGEHHRPDYAVSSPAVILGAAAEITKHIKLSSAVTVLSSDDPVRVFQDFATVDLLSAGRAEIMAGRGSFIESFPLFGYDLDEYDELFSEKLDLLLHLNEHEIVRWKGKHRPAIESRGVYPRPYQQKLPVWVAVGGTPDSVIRAGKLGLPMALAIIGGSPKQFVPHVQLYREAYQKSGHDPARLQLGINSHVFVGDSSQQAADDFYPPYAAVMTRLGRERGWPPIDRQHFESLRQKPGALLVGSPQQVTEKILYEHELFGNTRFLAQMTVGAMDHQKVMHSIELFAEKIAPVIRRELGSKDREIKPDGVVQ